MWLLTLCIAPLALILVFIADRRLLSRPEWHPHTDGRMIRRRNGEWEFREMTDKERLDDLGFRQW